MYHRKWNVAAVVGHIRKSEVDILCCEKSGAGRGSKEYLGAYQTVLSAYVNGLSASEKAEFDDMAVEWNERSPPEDVQRRSVVCRWSECQWLIA